MNQPYTTEDIRKLLDTNDRAVERAILHLYSQQTDDEQRARFSKYTNKVGFNGSDAGYGSYLATWLLSGKKLSGKHVVKARHMVRKYAGQLAKAANEKKVQADA